MTTDPLRDAATTVTAPRPTFPVRESDLKVLDQVLERAVVLATGRDDLRPRSQQREVAHNAYAVLQGRTHAADEAKTGTGKSIAYLSAIMLRAALYGERSVVSTESLSLQAQVVDKDAPVVADAVRDVTGVDVRTALMKGWSNYLCAADIADLKAKGEINSPLREWAVEQIADLTAQGDRHSFDGVITQAEWDDVSVSPAECEGASKCPFADVCKPHHARVRAGKAHVVVSNHSLLAVQAAHNVPAVISSKGLGRIDHVVVDEAHALPSQVRSQGAGEVSGRRVEQLVKGMESLVADAGGGTEVKGFAADGAALAAVITKELENYAPKARGGATAAIAETANPMENFMDAATTWVDNITRLVESRTKGASQDTKKKVRRFVTRCDSFVDAMKTAAEDTSMFARWSEVDQKTGAPVVRFSPVNVGPMLRQAVWNGTYDFDEDAELNGYWGDSAQDAETGRRRTRDGDKTTIEYPLGVVAVSATLPTSFSFEAGLQAKVTRHTSPLIDGLRASGLFVPPAMSDYDVEALAAPGTARTDKPRLDTARHRDWAANHVVNLASANGGRALILAATVASGKAYAQALRERTHGEFVVLDQWSGRPLRQVVAQWRADETAVLVGVKSLMTGVDAPGQTCSLVILDRLPRAPKNPVDEARLKYYMETMGVDRWTADRAVYVSDTAVLLEQAAGRLVRSVSDRGLVAVLDPRLRSAAGSKMRYAEQSRKRYVEAVSEFGHQPLTIAAAVAFLKDLRQDCAKAGQ